MLRIVSILVEVIIGAGALLLIGAGPADAGPKVAPCHGTKSIHFVRCDVDVSSVDDRRGVTA